MDRIGEANINNFGSKMIIKEYRTSKDIDVYFPQYNWVAKSTRYDVFKNGNIKCPYERSVYSVGYIGEGRYKASENGRNTKCYDTWHSMLKRCYDPKYHKRRPTYRDCKASEEFHNFQNFAKWDEDNYYEIEGEIMHLDKDILIKHNKIYSPETCIYVPQIINSLFVKCDKSRGESVIGTCRDKNGKYQVNCNLINPKIGKSKGEYLGRYETEIEAFEVYKYHKEKNIKEVADYYKNQIPERLYEGLCIYEVEIND